MVKIGDLVVFLGVIKTTDYTPLRLFDFLIKENVYEVMGIKDYMLDDYYFIHCSDKRLWFPIENFGYGREAICKKYNLK